MSKSEAERETRDALTKRFDVLIRLMLDEQLARDDIKRKDQLLMLDSAGLTSGEIGQILGRASKDIASDLKKLKSGGTKS
jgi:predicted transcriptional regulator